MTRQIKDYPLRPTLLVLSSDKPYEAQSLAERTARTYAEHMTRLTQKFSSRHWDIKIIDINDEEALTKAWEGFETGNMAILTGYTGTKAQNDTLAQITQLSNPISTLVSLGKNLADADIGIFNKSVSLLPQSLDDQFTLTNHVVKVARQENTWEKWDSRKSPDRLPAINEQEAPTGRPN